MEDLKNGKVKVSSPCSVIDEWRDGDCVEGCSYCIL